MPTVTPLEGHSPGRALPTLSEGWIDVFQGRGQKAVKTVRGPHEVVCFTEQPLEQIPVTVAKHSKYNGHGIAFRKSDLPPTAGDR